MVEVTEEKFRNIFKIPPHPFLSKEFIELNKDKVDRIVYLILSSKKPEVGLLAGIKNRKLICPVSAPFGGLFFRSDYVFINQVDEFLDSLKLYIKNNDVDLFEIILHPSLYNKSFYAKSVSSFLRNGYEVILPDITSWVDLNKLSNGFNYKDARKNCEFASKKNLKFGLVIDDKEKEEAYGIIKENRARFNRCIYMSYADVIKLNKIWPVDFFKVTLDDGAMIASAILYKYDPDICYAVFWGDADHGRKLRGTMDFLLLNIFEYYKNLGFSFIDIGISTENGNPNAGLLRFKETHNSITSLRCKFRYKNKIEKVKHNTSDIQSKNIGDGTIIWQYVIVLPGAIIGKNCNINSHCFIENDVVIGDNVTIKCGVYIWDGMVLESNVFVGPNVTFTNDKYPKSKNKVPKLEKTIIKEGASIGAGSVILCGITIGENALVGAGSVVTKNIPDNEVWVGNPARFLRYV